MVTFNWKYSKIVLTFNTGYVSEGIVILSRKDIAYEYVTTWFFLDLFASFPYEWVVEDCFGPSCDNVNLN